MHEVIKKQNIINKTRVVSVDIALLIFTLKYATKNIVWYSIIIEQLFLIELFLR